MSLATLSKEFDVIESYPYWNLNSDDDFLASNLYTIESYPYWNLNGIVISSNLGSGAELNPIHIGI